MASTRAGRLVRRPGGSQAIVPAPLPPDPPIEMAGHLPRWLAGASLALGRLDGVTSLLPAPDLFGGMWVKEEAPQAESGEQPPSKKPRAPGPEPTVRAATAAPAAPAGPQGHGRGAGQDRYSALAPESARAVAPSTSNTKLGLCRPFEPSSTSR